MTTTTVTHYINTKIILIIIFLLILLLLIGSASTDILNQSLSTSIQRNLTSSLSSSQLLHNSINNNMDPKDEVLRRWLSEKERREQLEKRNTELFRELRLLREQIKKN